MLRLWVDILSQNQRSTMSMQTRNTTSSCVIWTLRARFWNSQLWNTIWANHETQGVAVKSSKYACGWLETRRRIYPTRQILRCVVCGAFEMRKWVFNTTIMIDFDGCQWSKTPFFCRRSCMDCWRKAKWLRKCDRQANKGYIVMGSMDEGRYRWWIHIWCTRWHLRIDQEMNLQDPNRE